ncbi:MAG: hypothetical protein K6G26_03925 [Lachnospiraceae bacterium]|nr:hypothetical protein [Lachnospiraceae bacterium]
MIEVSNNKTLKLSNVLIKKYETDNFNNFDADKVIEQMKSYIKSKGNSVIGPVIQMSKSVELNDGRKELEVFYMLQCSNPIHNIDNEYSFKNALKVDNCMYCRYTGPEDKLSLAYEKIYIVAFESGIELDNEVYSIYLKNDNEMMVDIFIKKD